MSFNTGGQAFPRGAGPEGASFCNGEQGMTLRDYFAAQALTGYIAAYSGDQPLPGHDVAAGYAYEVADAMIAQRLVGGTS